MVAWFHKHSGTLVAVVVAALMGMAVSDFKGHASQADLDRAERLCGLRDTEIRASIAAHLQLAAAEFTQQAEFRGAVGVKLELQLDDGEGRGG